MAHCTGRFPTIPSAQLLILGVNIENVFFRELNAQFERYPALEADEPMVLSGYATFLVAVGLFVGWEGGHILLCGLCVHTNQTLNTFIANIKHY